MKKKLLGTLLCVSMVASMLAGCGGNDAANNAPANNAATDDAATDDTTADDAATDDAASAEGGKVYYLQFKPEVDEAWQAIAKEYTEATGVEVKVVTAASGTYEETLMSEIAKEDAPTLFQINGPVGYQNWKDYTLNLADTDLYANLSDKSLAITGEDGGVYGVPYTIEGYGIIYNDAIMQKYSARPRLRCEFHLSEAMSLQTIHFSFRNLRVIISNMRI